jgi:hypothetical protein
MIQGHSVRHVHGPVETGVITGSIIVVLLVHRAIINHSMRYLMTLIQTVGLYNDGR